MTLPSVYRTVLLSCFLLPALVQGQWTGASIFASQNHFQAVSYVGDTGLHVFGTGCVPRASSMGMTNENNAGTGQGYEFMYITPGVLRDVTLFNEGGQRFFYAVGGSGSFSDTISIAVRRSDLGGIWQFDTLHTGNHRYYNALHFFNAAEGYAVGGTSYGDGIVDHTLDSGRTWQQEQLIPGAQVSDIHFVDAFTGFLTTGGIRWLSCTSEELYPAGGIHRSTDGGATWTPVHSDATAGFTSVAFLTPQLGCATRADGTILRTTDGGETWSEATITVPLPFLLTGVDVTPSGTWFASGFRVSGVEGVILASQDGGLSWDLNHSTAGVNNPKRLYDVRMFDDDFGMAAGGRRSLYTTNGGDLPTGLPVEDEGAIVVVHDPVGERLRVSLPSSRQAWLRLMDVQGRTLSERRVEADGVPIAGLPRGVYLAMVMQEGRRHVQRIVVN